MGITEDQVRVIGSDDYMNSPLLTDREKACVLWAEHVTKNTAKSRDDVFEEVRRQFSDSEFVELTMVITYFNMRNRFQDSLRIPLDEPKVVAGITKGLHQDPKKMKAYYERIVKNWPESFPGPQKSNLSGET